MIKEINLCMGCMKEQSEADPQTDNCPLCGYGKENIAPASFLVPKTFLNNRYILGKLLSYNGEGALYLAFDTERNVKVTIKEYMPDTLCTRNNETIAVNADCVPLYKTYLSEFIELNKALVKTDGTLRIQKALVVFTENNTAYVVFEYIVGISLKSYLSNSGGTVSWEQAKELFPPLFTTLNIIHSQGIIHRGISPSTIIVNERSELYLINFGITASRTFGSELDFEVFNGYAPAELYNSCARQGSWTDVYGISAVLYRVLTGQIPPDAPSRLKNDSLTEPMLINRNIPPNVSAIITQGLSLKIENRIETINIFVDRLFETPPVKIFDRTSETIIKKPDQNSVTGAYQIKINPNPDIPNHNKEPIRRRKRKSNTTAITVCVMLGLTITCFLFAIILPAANPEMFSSASVTTTVNEKTDVTIQDSIVTQETDVSQKTIESQEPATSVIINEPLYKVPNFTEPARRYEIIEKSANYNFLKIVAEYEFNSNFAEGYIFEQDIVPDTDVKNGTVLNIKVSKGAEFVALPDYDGISLNVYKGMLSALNIKFNSEKEDSEIKVNTVIKCSVNVGDMVNVAKGQTVTIYYSTGKAPQTSPDETEVIADITDDIIDNVVEPND